jgi:hypothetical protein
MLPKETYKKIAIALMFALILASPFGAWAADSRDSWRNLSPKEKEDVQRNYQRWQNLPPEDKERLQDEWQRYRSLPEDRRDQLKRRFEDFRRGR